ncbi:MAG TPA: hypothetical protein P5272_04365 [Caldisericia bacterium]|nr:hypothetical protein [Caldisericia bacterium]HOL83004.1 hypothetical protein [Caldisericia bacterium]HPC56924.1 hypothetical protein [Caldisericia bacterium]HPP43536.1 hypothetical protein [Caldisericia bacterium]HRT37345.1 hypothetical protein [Caldisericia bacterium]
MEKTLNVIELSPKDKIIFTLGRFDDGTINIVDRYEIEDLNYKNNKILNVSEFKERMDKELIKLEETFINIDNIVSIYDKPTLYKKRYVLSSKEERKIKESDIDNMISLIRNSLEKEGKEIIQIFSSEFYIDDKKIEVPIGEKGKKFVAIFNVFGIEKDKIKILKSIFNRKKNPLKVIYFSPLLLVNGIKDSFSKNFIIDIENTFTYLIFGVDNIPNQVEYIELGTKDIIRDLSFILEIPPRDGEDYLFKKGVLDYKIFYDTDYPLSVEKKVASMRVIEIFELIEKKMKKLPFKFYPDEIVICGEGAKIKNIKEFTKEYFDLPASIGEPFEYKSDLKLDSLDVISAIGAIRSFIDKDKKESFFNKLMNIFEKIFD